MLFRSQALSKRIDNTYVMMRAAGLDPRRLKLTAICTVCNRAFINEVKKMNELINEPGAASTQLAVAAA